MNAIFLFAVKVMALALGLCLSVLGGFSLAYGKKGWNCVRVGAVVAFIAALSMVFP